MLQAVQMAQFDPKSLLNAVHHAAVFNRRVRVLAGHLAHAIPQRGTVLDLGHGAGSVAVYSAAEERDGLTGLLQRAGLIARLDKACAEAERGRSNVAVGCFAVDEFGPINRQFGRYTWLLYTSPSPPDRTRYRIPPSA